MGCYNNTCGISQFPIIAGDKTVNFIIVSTSWKTDPRPSYMNTAWNVIPIPFYGEYDDYGWQKDDKKQQLKYKFLSNFYKGQLVCMDADRASRDKIEDPFKDNKSLGSSIHGNVWHINNPWHEQDIANESPTRTISNFMVSRTVLDTLTESVVETYPTEKVYTKADFIETLDEFFKLSANNPNERRFQELSEKKKVRELDETENKEFYELIVEKLHGLKKHNLVQEFLTKKYGERSYFNTMGGLLRWVTERSGSEWRDEISMTELLEANVLSSEDIVNMFLMKSSMDTLRKSFHPMSGYGSQEGFGAAHSKLIVAMQKMIDYDNVRYAEYE
jgi:hypothetical protein